MAARRGHLCSITLSNKVIVDQAWRQNRVDLLQAWLQVYAGTLDRVEDEVYP